jgi:hypothetical protein
MKRFLKLHRSLFLAAVILHFGACTTSQPADPFLGLKEFDSTMLLQPNHPGQGCKAMFDSYCSILYAPGASGNLKIDQGADSFLVLQGLTANDFTGAYYTFAKAKVRHLQALPSDFQDALGEFSYFPRLNSFLNRLPREQMDLNARTKNLHEEYELESAWNIAVTETVLKRMDKKYIDFHKIKEDAIPLELQVDRKRVRSRLIAAISKSIWTKDPNWRKVEANFEKLRHHFISVIDRLQIPEEIRSQWSERIRTIQLAIPGSTPEISDTDCSSTQSNAYYYTRLNILTVCAGDFNSEDILETLAHEMAHALDFDRSAYLYEVRSKLGLSLTTLRHQVCTPKTFTCENWNQFKTNFEPNLKTLSGFSAELPEFQRCLKRRPTSKSLDEDDLERLAGDAAAEKISDLAESEVFLRITKAKIPLPSGKIGKNPNYLNPCDYYLWSKEEEAIDDDLNDLIFFTAEYQCSEGTAPEKLKNAILTAKSYSTKILKESLRLEGEFSSRKSMETAGFSASPVERFADVVGSYAVADYLSQIPTETARRNVFLASNSWQCTKPSLATRFPEEDTVQQEFVFDAHTGTDERKKEFFSAPVRESIGCDKDFSFHACELPMRSALNENTNTKMKDTVHPLGE